MTQRSVMNIQDGTKTPPVELKVTNPLSLEDTNRRTPVTNMCLLCLCNAFCLPSWCILGDESLDGWGFNHCSYLAKEAVLFLFVVCLFLWILGSHNPKYKLQRCWPWEEKWTLHSLWPRNSTHENEGYDNNQCINSLKLHSIRIYSWQKLSSNT